MRSFTATTLLAAISLSSSIAAAAITTTYPSDCSACQKLGESIASYSCSFANPANKTGAEATTCLCAVLTANTASASSCLTCLQASPTDKSAAATAMLSSAITGCQASNATAVIGQLVSPIVDAVNANALNSGTTATTTQLQTGTVIVSSTTAPVPSTAPTSTTKSAKASTAPVNTLFTAFWSILLALSI